MQHVRNALSSIDSTLSMLLEMVYWENIPIHQLSELLGLPRHKVGSQLDKAKINLRRAIELSNLPMTTQRDVLTNLIPLLRAASPDE